MSAKRFAGAAVCSPHVIASEVGLETLRAGGNAADAALATNLALGAVAPYLCGYGGDLFAMVWADGGLHAYNGSGRAPEAATREAVVARAWPHGALPDSTMPLRGPLSVTVPGAVDGWFALMRFASMPFQELAAPALRLAREGFEVSERGARSFAASARTYRDEVEWQRVYGGVRAGEVLRQPDLARTIEVLSSDGPRAYYDGAIAEAIVDTLGERGGLLAREDLRAHHGDWVEPLRLDYRDAQIVEMPPNTQGATVLEALAIAAGLPFVDAEPALREHLLIEAAKLALADRDATITDPSSMKIEAASLFEDDYVREQRARIESDRARIPAPGRFVSGGTAYLCAADANGMMVSLIQSNWSGFGSGITVPGWGINLHNRGSLFSLDPSHVNVIAPGKRTMHTLIPAMAFRGGEPFMTFGTMGGHGQAQTHLQLVVRMLDDGADPQDAIDAPRWCVRPDDWSVDIEPRAGASVIQGLRARGHTVRETPEAFSSTMGHAHAIVRDPRGGWLAASDPRAEGAARGF